MLFVDNSFMISCFLAFLLCILLQPPFLFYCHHIFAPFVILLCLVLGSSCTRTNTETPPSFPVLLQQAPPFSHMSEEVYGLVSKPNPY